MWIAKAREWAQVLLSVRRPLPRTIVEAVQRPSTWATYSWELARSMLQKASAKGAGFWNNTISFRGCLRFNSEMLWKYICYRYTKRPLFLLHLYFINFFYRNPKQSLVTTSVRIQDKSVNKRTAIWGRPRSLLLLPKLISQFRGLLWSSCYACASCASTTSTYHSSLRCWWRWLLSLQNMDSLTIITLCDLSWNGRDHEVRSWWRWYVWLPRLWTEPCGRGISSPFVGQSPWATKTPAAPFAAHPRTLPFDWQRGQPHESQREPHATVARPASCWARTRPSASHAY